MSDTTPRCQGYCSILSKFAVSRFEQKPEKEPPPQKYPELKKNCVYLAWAESDAQNAILYLHSSNRSKNSSVARSISAEYECTDEGALTVFFSFDDLDIPRRTSATFLYALIFRVSSTLPGTFKSMQRHANWISARPVLSVGDLFIIVRGLLSSSNLRSIKLTIDGIDKCEQNVLKCLEDLTRLANGSETRLKIIVSSMLAPTMSDNRDWFTLNLHDESETNYCVQDALGPCYNQVCLDRKAVGVLENFQSLTEARIRLKALLADQFLGSSLKNARSVLERPLYDLYAQSIGRLENFKPWVQAALSWIALSYRPLSLDELTIALNVPATMGRGDQALPILPNELEVELSHALGPFVEVRHGKIYFADSSVADFAQTYFNDQINTAGAVSNLATLTHAGITRRCLQYLMLSTSNSKESTVETRLFQGSKDRSLDDYAAMYWPYHYNAAKNRATLVQDVLEFFASGQSYETWAQRWSTYHDIDRINQAKQAPLVLAAKHGLAEVVKELLLQDGGEKSLSDRPAALETALQFNQLHVARQLLQFTAPTDTALLLMASIGNLDLIRDSFHRSTRYSDTLAKQCIGTAAFHGHLEVIRGLSEIIPNITSLLREDVSVLAESVNGGHLHAVEHLLHIRSHPLSDESGTMLLNLAARAGDCEIFKFLVSKGINEKRSNEDGVTCLHSAVAANNPGLVEDLLSAVSTNGKDCGGNTPLHIACMHNNSDAFDMLITNASVNIGLINEKGDKPIHLAARNGDVHMVVKLLEMGSSKTVCDGEQFDPLHLAVRGGHLNLVKELLNRGPEQERASHTRLQMSINSGPSATFDDPRIYGSNSRENSSVGSSDAAADQVGSEPEKAVDGNDVQLEEESEDEKETDEEEGTDKDATIRVYDMEPTPLHSAARSGYVDIMRELLEYSIDSNMVNRFGRTPLHLAAEYGNRAATKVLLEIGNNPNVADNHGRLPIHRACEAGNSLLLMHLIEFVSSTDALDTQGRAPLHVCAEYDHTDLVQLLLTTGVGVNTINQRSGEAALHIAAKFGHFATLNILIERGGDLELKDRIGQTPLHLALLRGHAEVSMSLLDAGADLSTVTARGQIPLFCAVTGGMDSRVIKRMLSSYRNIQALVKGFPHFVCESVSAGCEKQVIALLMREGWSAFTKDQNGKSPLSLALELERFAIAMQLLEPVDAESPPVEKYNECLVEMTLAGFAEGVQQVLKYPAVNPEQKGGPYGQTALAVAAEHGMIEILQLLLDRNANPNAKDLDGYSPLMLALSNGHLEAASLLLDHGANVDETAHGGITMVEFAARSGKREVIDLAFHQGASVTPGLLTKYVHDRDRTAAEALLCHGCSPFQCDSKGRTAIHEALDQDDAVFLKRLVTHGIDKVDGEQGWTPLHLAAMVGQVELLRVHDAHIKTPDGKGWTALHWAAFRGHLNAVRTLSDLHADLSAQDHQGMTALHLAAANGCVEVVRSLIEKNAPWNIEDRHKWKAAYHADARGHVEIVSLLADSFVPAENPEHIFPTGWSKDPQPKGLLIMDDGRKVIVGKSKCFKILIRTNLHRKRLCHWG